MEKKSILIDDVEYEIDDLPEAVLKHALNIQFVDNELAQRRNELAIADTARMAYLAALTKELKT